jgi:hypothetical protein
MSVRLPCPTKSLSPNYDLCDECERTLTDAVVAWMRRNRGVEVRPENKL